MKSVIDRLLPVGRLKLTYKLRWHKQIVYIRDLRECQIHTEETDITLVVEVFMGIRKKRQDRPSKPNFIF